MSALSGKFFKPNGSNKDEDDLKERNTKKVKIIGKKIEEEDRPLHQGSTGGRTYNEIGNKVEDDEFRDDNSGSRKYEGRRAC